MVTHVAVLLIQKDFFGHRQSRKAFNIAKLDFDQQNGLLMEEVPRLYEGRIVYLQPSLQALIKAQV